jgi:Protein of unknown function (DUF4230)
MSDTSGRGTVGASAGNPGDGTKPLPVGGGVGDRRDGDRTTDHRDSDPHNRDYRDRDYRDADDRRGYRDRRPRRGGPRLLGAGLLRPIIGGIVIIVVAALGISLLAGWRPSLPFTSRTIDRSSPAVLRSLQNLSEYHAASAHFEVVIDLQKDVKYVPDSLKGQRTLFVGVGTVDSVVDFGRLSGNAVTVSADRRTATIRLPKPTLSEPRIDPKKSYVVARQQGVLDRIGGLLTGNQSDDQKLYVAASQKMTDAARTDGSVLTLAQENTTLMLKGLLTALGFTSVTVTYDSPQ